MKSTRNSDIGSLVERALDGAQDTNRLPAPWVQARVRPEDLARMEEAFELGERHLRQMPLRVRI